MSETQIVADASAILALLKREPFAAELDPARLFRTTISAVNLSEVIEQLCAGGLNELEAHAAVAELELRVVDFDELQARLAAHLRPRTAAAGLSLGDRASLALGLVLGCPVVTADRAWASLDLRVKVIVIR